MQKDKQQEESVQISLPEARRSDANPIIISGLWIRSNDEFDGLEVLVEVPRVGGKRIWKRCWSEPFIDGGVVSHFIEPLGIRSSPDEEIEEKKEVE